jgi:hypothetical protein
LIALDELQLFGGENTTHTSAPTTSTTISLNNMTSNSTLTSLHFSRHDFSPILLESPIHFESIFTSSPDFDHSLSLILHQVEAKTDDDGDTDEDSHQHHPSYPNNNNSNNDINNTTNSSTNSTSTSKKGESSWRGRTRYSTGDMIKVPSYLVHSRQSNKQRTLATTTTSSSSSSSAILTVPSKKLSTEKIKHMTILEVSKEILLFQNDPMSVHDMIYKWLNWRLANLLKESGWVVDAVFWNDSKIWWSRELVYLRNGNDDGHGANNFDRSK